MLLLKNSLFILLTTLSCTTWAVESFQLEFSLDASHTDIRFPKGYPVATYLPEVERNLLLKVQVDATAKRLSPHTVRFQFKTPVEVETLQNGKTANLVFRHLDVELLEADMQTLEALQNHNLGSVLVGDEESHMTIDEVLEFAKAAPSLQPLVDRELPRIYVYNGMLGLDHFPFDLFAAGKPVRASINRIQLREIKSYDPESNRIGISSSTTSLMRDKVMALPRIEIVEPKIQDYLAIKGRVSDIREQMLPRLGTYTDKHGRKMMFISEPSSGSNVARPDFGRKKCDDEIEK